LFICLHLTSQCPPRKLRLPCANGRLIPGGFAFQSIHCIGVGGKLGFRSFDTSVRESARADFQSATQNCLVINTGHGFMKSQREKEHRNGVLSERRWGITGVLFGQSHLGNALGGCRPNRDERCLVLRLWLFFFNDLGTGSIGKHRELVDAFWVEMIPNLRVNGKAACQLFLSCVYHLRARVRTLALFCLSFTC